MLSGLAKGAEEIVSMLCADPDNVDSFLSGFQKWYLINHVFEEIKEDSAINTSIVAMQLRSILRGVGLPLTSYNFYWDQEALTWPSLVP
jgi:hypothetical protein